MSGDDILGLFLFGGMPLTISLVTHALFHGSKKLLTPQAGINALVGCSGALLAGFSVSWLFPDNGGGAFAALVAAPVVAALIVEALLEKFMPYADEVAALRQAEEEEAVEDEIKEEMRRRAKAKLASSVGRVFISYRREDGALARLIADQLENEFGPDHIFFDVDGIRLGADFVKAINDEVAKCDVLLALIGRNWLGRNKAGQRLFDNPNDYIRLEVAAALQRQIRVIPVLLDGATMPKGDQLPADLQELTRRNAHFLRHVSFKADMEILVRELRGAIYDP